MPFDPLSSGTGGADSSPLAKRLGWMLAYWAAGVFAVGAVGMLIRFWLKG